MTAYQVFKFLHVLSAAIFLGGVLARQLLRAFGNRAEDVNSYAALQRGAHVIDRGMVIGGGNAVIVFGIVLVILTDAPAFGFLQGAAKNWLLVSLLALILTSAVVPLVFIPWRKKVDGLMQQALAEGQITPQLRAASEDRRVRFFHLLELVTLVVVLFLMVGKPF